MDLTPPKPPAPWHSLFRCCRPSNDDGDDDAGGATEGKEPSSPDARERAADGTDGTVGTDRSSPVDPASIGDAEGDAAKFDDDDAMPDSDAVPDPDAVPDLDDPDVRATTGGSSAPAKEIQFYQFLAFAFLRHFFGDWLSGLDPKRNPLFESSRLSLTRGGSGSGGKGRDEGDGMPELKEEGGAS